MDCQIPTLNVFSGKTILCSGLMSHLGTSILYTYLIDTPGILYDVMCRTSTCSCYKSYNHVHLRIPFGDEIDYRI